MNRLKLPAAGLVSLALLASAVSGCQAQPPSAADKAFGEKVRAYLLAHPEVIAEAIEKLQAKESQDKEAAAHAAISAHRQALEHDPRDGVLGNPKGAITLVEFFDYRCPYCKAAEPDLEKLLAANSDVRLVLKEFPILDVEDQSHISENAARGALAALHDGKYAEVHTALMGERHLDEDVVHQILAKAGVDTPADKTEAGSKATSDLLADNHALAKAIGVDGTPAFIIGDTLISGARTDEIEAAIVAARKGGKVGT
jgi:protein-disulfide isomerase